MIRIGTSGWVYKHWHGAKEFYPENLPAAGWLAHYCRFFDTVECNNSFYRLPSCETFKSWNERLPKGFVMALKYSRYGTHMKRLKDADQHIPFYLANAQHLGDEHTGPILVQLPERFHNNELNRDRLSQFLAIAPRQYKWAVEFRHESWLVDETYDLLSRHNAALCIHDMLANHPWKITASFTYIRYHGPRKYSGSYSSSLLLKDAQKIFDLAHRDHTDVWVYFNNDLGGHAWRNALELKSLVGALEANNSGKLDLSASGAHELEPIFSSLPRVYDSDEKVASGQLQDEHHEVFAKTIPVVKQESRPQTRAMQKASRS
jgi:uncharacterized protein YecE (DUF72 family)